jgi:hypothetical protein
MQPLAGAGNFCQATFADQVLANPCDNDSPTTRTCGTYKVWESLFIGSQTCVYDTTGTALVGARQCDSTFLPACTSGCIVYGIAESAYATCGADAPACP